MYRVESRKCSLASAGSSSSCLQPNMSRDDLDDLQFPMDDDKENNLDDNNEHANLSSKSSTTNLMRKASSGSLNRSALGLTTLRSNRSFPSLSPSSSSATSLGALFFIGERMERHACNSCGVDWSQEQFSLDCNECDGFALSRPCDKCEGHCGNILTRNEAASNALGKAVWIGSCRFVADQHQEFTNDQS